MSYLSFADYQSMGGKLPNSDFIQAEFLARKKIDELTFGKLAGESPVRESVKMCAFGLIQRGYCGALDGKEYASVTEGGISITYDKSNIGKSSEFIRTCLSDEPENLFYCGN